MALSSGTKLGPYEIQSPLGAGGMGEVYRARDTRLDRTVAIKVLASHLSSSPELKQRMEREARAISSLNHPHICHLYDIGSQDGIDSLGMEFLEGETLAPGSASAPSFTAAATLSGPSPLSPLTTAGTIIGTIQYMSPEQIEGKEADARSDIFAFGAVLYEMVTGKRPFAGKSQISLASSILENDPEPVSALKPLTPTAFEHVVTTCLQKNPEERYQSAQDIKLELQWIAAARTEPAVAALPPSRSRTRERLILAGAVVAAILLG